MSNPPFLRISPTDNVLVALRDIATGEILISGDREVVVQEPIPAKHKIAMGDLQSGDPVYMYGVLVGRATRPIASGALVSTDNLKHAAEVFGRRRATYQWQPPDVSRFVNRTFMGYHRADGQVGTRNYWLVIPLVFCENRNILVLRDAFLKELGYAQPDVYRNYLRHLSSYYSEHGTTEGFSPEMEWNNTTSGRMFPGVDGIKFLTHESGCGETRDDSENLCALLAGYCVNPNVAGVTVLSLGCQHAQIQLFREKLAEKDPDFAKPLLLFERQKWETEYAMLTEAIRQTFAGLVEINRLERKPAGLEHLSIGVKCGGSDGFSGISANPATGHVADMIVALGGKVLMAEYPELCGVEQELIDRCVSDETADNFIHLMREYARRAEAIGAGFDMNRRREISVMVSSRMPSNRPVLPERAVPLRLSLQWDTVAMRIRPDCIWFVHPVMMCFPRPAWQVQAQPFSCSPPDWERQRVILFRRWSKSPPTMNWPEKCRISLTSIAGGSSQEKKPWIKWARRCWSISLTLPTENLRQKPHNSVRMILCSGNVAYHCNLKDVI